MSKLAANKPMFELWSAVSEVTSSPFQSVVLRIIIHNLSSRPTTPKHSKLADFRTAKHIQNLHDAIIFRP